MRILAEDPRILSMPSRYVQGAGALGYLGRELARICLRPLLIVDTFILKQYGKKINLILEEEGMHFSMVPFEGFCTQAKADEYVQTCMKNQCDLIAGIGGGAAMDIAKAVSIHSGGAGLPTASIPTVASNDAPTSRACVLYTEDGVLENVEFLVSNPALVLVDTAVIAKAPVHFLISGIGDALTTKFEAEQCLASGHRSRIDARQTLTGMAVAELCYQTLHKYARQAVRAVESGVVTEALEAIVEATILLSGVGFENGGLAAAHALTRGLSKVEQLRGTLHGYEVAYGLLVQFVLEGRDDDFLTEMINFYQEIGLPGSLRDLGISKLSTDILDTIVEFTCNSPESHVYKMVVPVNKQRLKDAILVIESLDL